MAIGRHPYGSTSWSVRRHATQCMIWSVAAVVLHALGGVSEAAAKGGAPLEPYGTNAEIQRCVVNMEASLHGRSVSVHAIPRRTFKTEAFWRIIWA